jgi:glycosyltransferase involved in cell wall biosynthesis
MKYSVVIPLAGDPGRLSGLLWSLEEKCRRRHVEVVVVADEAYCQNDIDRLELLRKQRRVDIFVDHGSSRGFAAAVNTGMRNCSADIVAVFHADVLLGPNTLGRLASRLKPSGPADIVSAVSCCAPHSAYVLSQWMGCRLRDVARAPKPDSRECAKSRLVEMYGDFDFFCKLARLTQPDLVYATDGYLFAAMFPKELWRATGEMDESVAGGVAADRLWVDKLRDAGRHMYIDRSTYCHHDGGSRTESARYEAAMRTMLRDAGRLL